MLRGCGNRRRCLSASQVYGVLPFVPVPGVLRLRAWQKKALSSFRRDDRASAKLSIKSVALPSLHTTLITCRPMCHPQPCHQNRTGRDFGQAKEDACSNIILQNPTAPGSVGQHGGINSMYDAIGCPDVSDDDVGTSRGEMAPRPPHPCGCAAREHRPPGPDPHPG
jgi:hypothetical protein